MKLLKEYKKSGDIYLNNAKSEENEASAYFNVISKIQNKITEGFNDRIKNKNKVKLKEFYLVDDKDYIIARYEFDVVENHWLQGKIYSVIAWDDDGICDEEFFAEMIIKWDECSHWNFYGEDYDPNIENSNDSYYHICGNYSYNNFLNIIIGAYNIAKEHYDKYNSNDMFEGIDHDLPKGYRIEEVNND